MFLQGAISKPYCFMAFGQQNLFLSELLISYLCCFPAAFKYALKWPLLLLVFPLQLPHSWQEPAELWFTCGCVSVECRAITVQVKPWLSWLLTPTGASSSCQPQFSITHNVFTLLCSNSVREHSATGQWHSYSAKKQSFQIKCVPV